MTNTEWNLPDERIVLDGEYLHIYMTRDDPSSNLRTRYMSLFDGDQYSGLLDDGADPMRDGWTNDDGVPIAWENGIGYFTDRDMPATSVACVFENGRMTLKWDTDDANCMDMPIRAWAEWDEDRLATDRIVWGWTGNADGYWAFDTDVFDIMLDTSRIAKLYFEYSGHIFFIETMDDAMCDYELMAERYDMRYGTDFADMLDPDCYIGTSSDGYRFIEATQVWDSLEMDKVVGEFRTRPARFVEDKDTKVDRNTMIAKARLKSDMCVVGKDDKVLDPTDISVEMGRIDDTDSVVVVRVDTPEGKVLVPMNVDLFEIFATRVSRVHDNPKYGNVARDHYNRR